MAKLDCKGCGKSVPGRGKFCNKECKTKWIQRMDAAKIKFKPEDEVPVRINARTVIMVKHPSLVEAALAKYKTLMGDGLTISQPLPFTGIRKRGVALG